MLHGLLQLHVFHFDKLLNLLRNLSILHLFTFLLSCWVLQFLNLYRCCFLCHCTFPVFFFLLLRLLLNSCSSFNLFSVSCSFIFSSYNLFFSLFLRSSLFIYCSLFASVAKTAFYMIWFSLILELCSTSEFCCIENSTPSFFTYLFRIIGTLSINF